MTIVAIDLGTERTQAAALTTSGESRIIPNRNGENFTFSDVYFNEDGSTQVGTEAINASLANPKRGVSGWKRSMGTDEVLYTDDKGREYFARDIATILLESVKADAEANLKEPVTEVAISVPANYTMAQKQQTEEAASKAGLKTILKSHEPTCGALAQDILKFKNGVFVVYDLGGGTFDVSIAEVNGNVCKIIATGGIPKLGGRDFNQRIKDKVLDEHKAQYGYRPCIDEHAIYFQDLYGRIEQFKINLSTQKQASIIVSCNGDLLNMTVTRKEFESWVEDLVKQTIKQTEKVIEEAGLTWKDISAIFPIGGGSMMPIVPEELEKASGKKVTRNCEPHCAVALGGAVAARIECDRINRDFKVGKVTLPRGGGHLQEILSRSVGVLTLTEDNRNVCSEILAKDTPIPSVQMKLFMMTELDQTDVKISILQGMEGQMADDCTALGYFELNDLPARPDVRNRIEVTFDLDASGMLTATARDNVSNKKAEVIIDYTPHK